jgi:ubiquinone/menaquinone biosynthesis C-methylase UbiE
MARQSFRSSANSLRYWILNLIFKRGVAMMCNDQRGRTLLLESLAPQPGERILDLSAEGGRSGLALASQFPEAHFVAVEGEETAFIAISEKIKARKITNLKVLRLTGCRIDYEAASFDKVVSLLVLHSLPPADKLALLKEILRVLRRGGTLHIGNFDTPQIPREYIVFRFTRYLFGEASARVHLDGSWVKMLREAGFSGVRRLPSYSTIVGRVALVRARRPSL